MWITLTNIAAQNANSGTNPAAMGSLPITGLHGAVHAALRAQGLVEPAFGMIVRIHDISPRFVGKGGLGTGNATTYQGRVFAKPVVKKKSDLLAGPNDPLPKMDFRISLALEVSDNCDPKRLKNSLRMESFCGGRCIDISQVSACDDVYDALDTLQASGAGLMLTDETAKMLDHAVLIKDSALASLVDLLADGELSKNRKMAIGNGYRMLAAPFCKADSRNPSIPHAYAEPLLGYAELHPLGEAEDQDRALIWRSQINTKTLTCTLKGTQLCH